MFNTYTEEDYTVISPQTDLTGNASDKLRELMQNFTEDGKEKYLFNLEKVGEIDALGVSVFLVLKEFSKKKNGKIEFKIINAHKDLYNLFHAIKVYSLEDVRKNT